MSDPILELLAAPPSPALRVDEEAVHAGGRRRLRRRNLRRTGAGLVGLAGAAAIAFSALGPGFGGEALPAGPSPTVGSTQRTSADVVDGRYAVEVVPGAPADQPNIIFYKVEKGKRIQLAGSRADATVVSMGTGSGAEGVMLGTAPADATSFLTVTRGGSGSGGQSWDQQPLPGTGYQAVALEFDDPKDVDSYVDTIWMNPAGQVRSAAGVLLPSTKVSSTDTLFVARDAGVMGVFTADGSVSQFLSKDVTTTMGYGQKPDGGSWTWTSVTLLPAGAQDVSFTWSNAATNTAVTLRSVGDAVVAVARATAPGTGSGPLVTTVTWTDQAGTRHTDAVK